MCFYVYVYFCVCVPLSVYVCGVWCVCVVCVCVCVCVCVGRGGACPGTAWHSLNLGEAEAEKNGLRREWTLVEGWWEKGGAGWSIQEATGGGRALGYRGR